MQIRIRRRLLPVALIPILAVAGCGDDEGDEAAAANDTTVDGTAAAPAAPAGEPVDPPARLLPERHPRAGDHRRRAGLFARRARRRTSRSRLVTFNSGTEAIEALFADAIDPVFIGPNPAINGYAQSDGEALRIVAGTTSGGASLVVRDGIDSPARPRRHDARDPVARQHPGRRPAGVARRAGLRDRHQPAAATSTSRRRTTPTRWPRSRPATIDGAWVPEPWATRLVLEGGGHVLVDEADLWPDGAVRHDPPDRRPPVPRGRTPTS